MIQKFCLENWEAARIFFDFRFVLFAQFETSFGGILKQKIFDFFHRGVIEVKKSKIFKFSIQRIRVNTQ